LLAGERKKERNRLTEQLPEGVPFPIAWEGVDDLPVLFVNQVLGQVGQQTEVVLTFGQLTPPAILGETQAEREQQIRDVTRIPIKPVARLALTRAGLEQLITVLHQTLENHDKAMEMMTQMQRVSEGGEQ
jgi:hypothetical protein